MALLLFRFFPAFLFLPSVCVTVAVLLLAAVTFQLVFPFASTITLLPLPLDPFRPYSSITLAIIVFFHLFIIHVIFFWFSATSLSFSSICFSITLFFNSLLTLQLYSTLYTNTSAIITLFHSFLSILLVCTYLHLLLLHFSFLLFFPLDPLLCYYIVPFWIIS